jgi:hypothetical protein
MNPVLVDALQIPATMLQFHRIPVDSTGMELDSTGFHRNGTEFCWIPEELMHSCRNRTGIQIFLSLYSVIF